MEYIVDGVNYTEKEFTELIEKLQKEGKQVVPLRENCYTTIQRLND